MKKFSLLLALVCLSIIRTTAQTPTPTINGTPPPFIFNGSGVSQVGQTFTFGGGSGGGSSPLLGVITGLHSPEQINMHGTTAYVTGDSMGFRTIDVSNPSAPSVLASVRNGTGMFGNFAAYPLVYLSIFAVNPGGTTGGIVILNVTDPTNPVELGNLISSAYQGSEGIVVVFPYAYVVNQNAGRVDVFDVSIPATPTHVTALTDASLVGDRQMVYYSDHLYMGNTATGGVQIVDITTRTSPTLGSPLSVGDFAGGISISGARMYFTNGNYGQLWVYDLADPALPSLVTTISDARLYYSSLSTISGNYLYSPTSTNNSGGGVTVVDISTPASPKVVSAAVSLVAGGPLDGTAACASDSTYLYCGSGFLGVGGNSFSVLSQAALTAPAIQVIPYPSQPTPPSILYTAGGLSLPPCSSELKGAGAVVGDATLPAYNATYLSGGGVVVPVVCDGTNWKTH